MPRKNGIQVIQSVKTLIKRLNHEREVKIMEPRFVFLTAFSSKGFLEFVKNQGVEAVYDKPIEKDLLKRIILDFN